MIELRKAGPNDACLLAETRKIVWCETYRGIYPDEKLDCYDLSTYTQRDMRHLSNRDEHYYLFMDGGICAGYFSYGPSHYGTYKDFSLCLNHLYILGSCKGRGLGKWAFQVIHSFCLQEKNSKFYCGCNAHNIPAIGFYQHMGGIQGDLFVPHENKADDIIHFEFYIGE